MYMVYERSREKRRSLYPAAMLCRQLDSVGVLLRKQDVLMLAFMVNLVSLSPHSQRSTYRDAHAVSSSSIVDLAQRCQAEKANSFAQVPRPSPKRTTKRYVTGTMLLSMDSLQHLQDYLQVFVPVPVACRLLPGGAGSSACADDRSGPRVADPASISTISGPSKTTKRC